MDGKEEWKAFDNFIDYCRSLPHAKARILDPIRYCEMEVCYCEMKKVAQDNSGKLTYEIHPEDGYGVILMESDDLIWYPRRGFSRALMLANNLEIYPLKSGKLRTAIMFYGITKAIKEKQL